MMRNIATFTLVSFTVICHVTGFSGDTNLTSSDGSITSITRYNIYSTIQGSESTISNSTNHGSSISSDECSDVTATCSMAAKCCQMGVGDYGWIAAAVGWGLWFITLILLCANKLSKMGVDEQKKYVRA
ncbi:transmembrane protein 213-like isoform X1 [Huso huso]|uniref:Transmembrane protein 213-like isoform X1 n=1 Tax=Huso huso TaxID=61971 RepID=A0ABR0ZTZ0_HUSHU